MTIKKKYAQLVNFINLFKKFNDAESSVEVTDAEYNTLLEMLSDFGINIGGDSDNNPIQEFIDKYDYDDDGVVTSNDYNIPVFITHGIITANDPKYDAVNRTYNGKSVDLNDDGHVDLTDSIIWANKKNEFMQSFSRDWKHASEMYDWYSNYYTTHNYTWPTIEEADAYYATL